MGNPPWLDNLSDDWVPLPGTPTTPSFARSPVNNHSRRSSLQNTPSRIPVPARRSVEPSQSPASDAKKKVSRPCHFIKREPPTPKTPRTPKTPSKPRSPAPDKLKKTPKPNPPSGRKHRPAMEGKSPLRSVSNASNLSTQQSTVQIRPKRDKGKEGTPEWRKRLVNGEIPAGEQRDLFAPIGLESVFKPPSPGSPTAQNTPIPKVKQPDNAWNFSVHSASANKENSQGQRSQGSRRSDRKPSGRSALGKSSQKEDLEIHKRSKQLPSLATETHNDSPDDAQMRSASGLEDLRNEDITPITFSRTNTVDGNGASEIIKSALKQVTNKLERLHLAPEDRPGSRASDSVLLSQAKEVEFDAAPEDDLFDVTSNSLPQDLSMGTLDYRGRSAFASLQEESYDDRSFHKPRLSSPAFPSQHLSPFIRPTTRIRSSPPFYHKMNTRTDPPTLPRPLSAHVGTSESKSDAMGSSGSPLKLFGLHDTFTNNKLLRRMSQFEETLGDESEEDEPVSPSEEARRKGETRSSLSSKQDSIGEHVTRRHDRPRSRNTQNPHINHFGEGQLDNFGFSDASPYEAKFLKTDSPEPNFPPPGQLLSADRFTRRRSYRRTSRQSEPYNTMSSVQNAPRTQDAGSMGRRDGSAKANATPSSPVKDPNPKRRRTLVKTLGSLQVSPGVEDSDATEELSLLQRSLMQHGLRYDDGNGESGPRPRTPTPHQTGSFERKQLSPSRRTDQLGNNDHERHSSPISHSVPSVVVRPANERVRKGSITTQDFLDEATKVMDLIRSKGTTKGGLARVDESDMEDQDGNQSYEDESTIEEFSRPPSREGVDLRKLREPQEPNPRILSHLRKFQEHDDLDFGVNGSVMSLHLQDGNDNTQIQEHEPGNSDPKDSSDDWPRETPLHQRMRKLPVPPVEEQDGLYHLLRLNTETSSKSFSARSVPTGSSQSSHAKGVLSSDIVSHLIPEQVNGLTYDRLRHQWVKEGDKPSRNNQEGGDGDSDPFKDIPDLSVDELQEMMRTQNSGSPQKTRDSPRAERAGAQSPLSAKPARTKSEPGLQTTGGAPSAILSSVQSGVSRLTSSQPTSGTRETSWGTDAHKSAASSSDVEHEIKLHEGRLSQPPQHHKNRTQQARVVTISFSSPLVSQIEYSDDDSPSKLRKLAAGNLQPETQIADHSAPREAQPSPHNIYEPTFRRRSISKIDERSEDAPEAQSLVPRSSEAAEAMSAESNMDDSLVYLQNHLLDTSYSFYLSPLPDFTVDQIDQPIHLEVSYVAQRTHPTSLRQVHGTFALATEELVKHITEAEPYEPYWEHLRRLILRRKGLITLHKLCDFCPRLEELDVSDNDIGQLSGVPSTLRNLRIQNNRLSNLTSWGHLVNLQYLDISGNDVENLDGVSGLIHLRELKADNNKIRNIEGVFDLDGLLSLKLRNNCLSSIDFDSAELTRLGELDLSHNEIVSIHNIDHLPALSELDVSFNRLDKVGCSTPLTALRSLKLSGNRLHSLDIGHFPALTLLYVDNNSLSTISGLGQAQGLEVLSAREQALPDNYSGGFFDLDLGLVKDVRKVFLSSNSLSAQSISPSTPLLSLQLLDLASCRLEALPADFAVKFPNVKVLNLNFNSLPGVNELVGMNCLSRLMIAGNSITRLRRLCQVLSRIGQTKHRRICSLQKVDLRGNPLTVRFYPPPITGNGKQTVQNLIANEKKSTGKTGVDLDVSILADLEHHGQLLHMDKDEDEANLDRNRGINDPYTLPPADPLADQKHLAHLDEATRLRRRVFELMLYAGTGGSLKFLDGLQLRPSLEPGSDMDRAWSRLEQLGVLKKKGITG